MTTSEKQTAFDSVQDEVSCARIARKWLATQNRYRSYYPNIKIRKTNPFVHRASFDSAQDEVSSARSANKWLATETNPFRRPTSSPKTFFRETNPFSYGAGQMGQTPSSKSPLERGFRGVLFYLGQTGTSAAHKTLRLRSG